MLKFDANTGFTATETEDVRSEVARQWKDAFAAQDTPELNTDPETPAGQLVDSQTAAITQKDAEVAFLATQFNPQTATGVWQDALGKIYFLTRHPAVASTAVCTCSGRYGTVIPAGARIRSTYDQSLWSLDADTTIPKEGAVDAQFTCAQTGAVEAARGVLTQIMTVTPGWDSVTNAAAATVGADEETQSAFEARRYDSVALNARGTIQAVYARVAQLDGVVAVYTAQNRTNVNAELDGCTLTPHSIYVAVLGGADSAIADAIYCSCSAGADYNGNTSVAVTDANTGAIETVKFMRPEELDLHCRVRIQNANLPNGYEALIREAVRANFYGEDTATVNGSPLLRIKMGDTIYASRFNISIMNAGISSILDIALSTDGSTWAASLHVPIDKSPVLLADNITVEVADE